MQYSKEVMKNFMKPKNMGEIKNADGVGKIGNPRCVLPNEKILLNGEFNEIKDSNKNDLIVSHDSTINQIMHVNFRRYKGNILKLKNQLGSINLTPEHLVYAISIPKNNKFLRTKWKKTLIPAWYHAEQLKKGDIVLYPLQKLEKDVKFLERDIKKPLYDFRSFKIPQKIPLNSDLLRLFGYFISEGHVSDKPSKTYISFALNINEIDIVKDISFISKKLFNLDIKTNEFPKKNTIIVYLYSAQLARWFKKLFGNGAKHKKFPEFIMSLPVKKQKFLIEGFWKGDGHINLKRNTPRAGYTTISYQLAQQIKVLLLRQKIIPSIYTEKEKISKWANHKEAYRIHIGQSNSLSNLCKILKLKYNPRSYKSISSWIDKNYLYIPITKIEKLHYNGNVYNLEVGETHSFLSEAFSLHNCGDVMHVYINVKKNKKGEETIKDIKFKTFGCMAAIATSSMVTQIAKGKTLDKAQKITRKDISKSLKGLPPIKEHCSNLASDALKKAIKDYRKKK